MGDGGRRRVLNLLGEDRYKHHSSGLWGRKLGETRSLGLVLGALGKEIAV